MREGEGSRPPLISGHAQPEDFFMNDGPATLAIGIAKLRSHNNWVVIDPISGAENFKPTRRKLRAGLLFGRHLCTKAGVLYVA